MVIRDISSFVKPLERNAWSSIVTAHEDSASYLIVKMLVLGVEFQYT